MTRPKFHGKNFLMQSVWYSIVEKADLENCSDLMKAKRQKYYLSQKSNQSVKCYPITNTFVKITCLLLGKNSENSENLWKEDSQPFSKSDCWPNTMNSCPQGQPVLQIQHNLSFANVLKIYCSFQTVSNKCKG